MTGRNKARNAVWAVGACLLSLLLVSSPTLAADEATGTFGASFLRIPIGAKAMALPDVVAGMRPDASSTFGNPAHLAGVASGEVFLTTANWLDDLSLNAASVVWPIKALDLRWSFATRLLYSGDLKGYDSSLQVVSEESFYDLALSTGLSRRIESLGLSVGGDVTLLREHLALVDGSGVVFAFGASVDRSGNRFEVFARDIGGEISFEGQNYPIDSRIVAGYARSFSRPWGKFDLGGQMTFSRSSYKRLEIGGAYFLNRYLTLRSGVNHFFQAPDHSATPMSAGLGFHFGNVALDYGFTPQEFFPTTHTFSVVLGFGGGSGDHGPPTPVFDEPTLQTGATSSIGKSAALPEIDGFAVIAGVHARLASARSEARALRLLDVPAVAEKVGTRYRVLVGRYRSMQDAEAASARYQAQGHRFLAVANTP